MYEEQPEKNLNLLFQCIKSHAASFIRVYLVCKFPHYQKPIQTRLLAHSSTISVAVCYLGGIPRDNSRKHRIGVPFCAFFSELQKESFKPSIANWGSFYLVYLLKLSITSFHQHLLESFRKPNSKL
jgi:hypothetical protein